MKKLLSAILLMLATSSAFAQTDISKFEGTWEHLESAFNKFVGPKNYYIRIKNTDDGINVRFKQVNEAFNGNSEYVFYDQGENVYFDGEAIHCVVPHNYWGVRCVYRLTIKQGVLYCWLQRTVSDEDWVDERVLRYYNENDNW